MRLLLSIVEGRLVRDLFENGFLDQLTDAGADVTVLSPATRHAPYVSRWQRPGVRFVAWEAETQGLWQRRAWSMRKRFGRKLGWIGEEAIYRLEQHTFLKPQPEHLKLIDEARPDLYLATHTLKFDEEPLICAARARGVPTLGLVRSWDNVHKGLRARPDELTVWNAVNRQEVLDLERFAAQRVHIVGPTQFDPYFDPKGVMSRAEFCATLDLDPTRPIITLATIGQFFPGFDETYLADFLLELIERGEIARATQLVIRLHPWSRYEEFHRFAKRSNVRLSFIDKYVAGLSWMMTREDVVWMGNLLRHSDAVVTPGSTLTLEAAIFDTPTLVPIFHTTQPRFGEWYFKTWVISKHFGKIRDEGLAPIDDTVDGFVAHLKEAMSDRSFYREARARLCETYIPQRDGRSTERLSALVVDRLRARTHTARGGLKWNSAQIPENS